MCLLHFLRKCCKLPKERDQLRGRERGRNPREGIREKERWQIFADPRAGHHLVLRLLNGQVQRCQAVALDQLGCLLWETCNELLQHHSVDDLLNVTSPSQQSYAACIQELLSHHKGPATLVQVKPCSGLWPTCCRMALSCLCRPGGSGRAAAGLPLAPLLREVG